MAIHTRFWGTFLTVSFLAVGLPTAVRAESLLSPSLQNLAAQAELIFSGTVERIEYRLSEPGGPEQQRTPYTFVTYQIDELFFGNVSEDTLTLRFLGGLDETTQRRMVLLECPQFRVGDQNVLFVRRNTRSLCPLVQWEHGRRSIGDEEGTHADFLSTIRNLTQQLRPSESIFLSADPSAVLMPPDLSPTAPPEYPPRAGLR